MYLRKMTFIVIITAIASFSIRTTGTLSPQIFQNIFIVKATILINILFILSLLLFWLVFYLEYIAIRKVSLTKFWMLAILGSFAVSVLYMKQLPFVFGLNIHFSPFFMNPYFDALVPLISSVFHLIFFISFKRSLETREKKSLNGPVLSIIIGNSIFICLHLIVLSNFIVTHKFEWLEHMPRTIAVSTVPLIVLAVFFMLYFYYQFYRYLDSRNNIENVPA